MPKENSNCLEGMRCPNCRSREPFAIYGKAWFKVYDDGSDTFESLEWSSRASCRCEECGYLATVKAFQIKRKKKRR